METPSETSVESGSSNMLERTAALSHSRESSADTSVSQTLRGAPMTPMKVGAVGESRNRPHSYSGGLSNTDLIRLRQAGGSPGNKEHWSSSHGTPERQLQAEQPSYPSLTVHTGGSRPQDMSHLSQLASPGDRPDEQSNDYQVQQRQFNAMQQGLAAGPGGPVPSYVSGRPNNVSYRQPPRTFNPTLPPVMPSPTNFAYAAPPPPPMPMGNPQQPLYEMMLPTPPLDNPTMARLQQQASFRGHQHSTSDPTIRDPTALALLNSNIQAFAAGQMYPPALPPPAALSMFASQFYGTPQDAYASPDLAAAQMMARLQSQYGGVYGVPLPGQNGGVANLNTAANAAGQGLGPGGTGPSANNRKLGLYKTELCRSWEEKGSCRYGAKCQFAHGEDELRKVQRHPKVRCPFFYIMKLSLTCSLLTLVQNGDMQGKRPSSHPKRDLSSLSYRRSGCPGRAHMARGAVSSTRSFLLLVRRLALTELRRRPTRTGVTGLVAPTAIPTKYRRLFLRVLLPGGRRKSLSAPMAAVDRQRPHQQPIRLALVRYTWIPAFSIQRLARSRTSPLILRSLTTAYYDPPAKK